MVRAEGLAQVCAHLWRWGEAKKAAGGLHVQHSSAAGAEGDEGGGARPAQLCGWTRRRRGARPAQFCGGRRRGQRKAS